MSQLATCIKLPRTKVYGCFIVQLSLTLLIRMVVRETWLLRVVVVDAWFRLIILVMTWVRSCLVGRSLLLGSLVTGSFCDLLASR